MPISPRHSAHDIASILCDENDLECRKSKEKEILKIFLDEDREKLGDLFCQIATEIKARASTLPFPDNSSLGLDGPNRSLQVTIHYVDEIGREFKNPDSNSTTVSLALQGFGTCACVISALFDHLSQQGYNP